ncbi:MAG: aspartate carbamoyltransferase, partial [Methylococcales bacterium]|nr:aspartate carbamoyltransferase [Methylococcales bacterium]
MKTIVLFMLALISTNVLAVEPASEARLNEVVARGSHVMPFDLEKTTHIFSKTEKGGVQQVIVKD